MEHFRGEMYARLTLLPALRQSAAVNVSQSRCAFSLRSWDVFAYGLLPNRLSPLGQASKSSPRRISTGRLHALQRFHSPPINLIVFEAPYRITP